MPRKARIDIPGILQHIIARGIERRNIFEDDRDRGYFLEQLGKVITKNGAKCYGWVLMPNHFHLVMMSGKGGISKIMRQLLTRYAVYFNHKKRRSGYLFQNRYKSIVCERDVYLLELVRYVHLNPIRARLVKNIEELSEYRWSGHRVLLGLENRDWQVRGEILNYFGKKEKIAVKGYKQFLEEGIGLKRDFRGGGLIRSLGGFSEAVSRMRSKERQSYDERILGSGEFVEEVLKIHESDERDKEKMRSKIKDIKELINIIANRIGVEVKELTTGKKNKEICKARGLISYIGQYYMGEKGVEIGKALKKSAASISILYNKGKELIEQDKEGQEILHNILTF